MAAETELPPIKKSKSEGDKPIGVSTENLNPGGIPDDGAESPILKVRRKLRK